MFAKYNSPYELFNPPKCSYGLLELLVFLKYLFLNFYVLEFFVPELLFLNFCVLELFVLELFGNEVFIVGKVEPSSNMCS